MNKEEFKSGISPGVGVGSQVRSDLCGIEVLSDSKNDYLLIPSLDIKSPDDFTFMGWMVQDWNYRQSQIYCGNKQCFLDFI